MTSVLKKNTLISSFETVISLLLGFGTYLLITSKFGYEALGVYALLNVFTLLGVVNLLDFGQEAYLISYFSGDQPPGSIRGFGYIFAMSVSLCLSLIVGLSTLFEPGLGAEFTKTFRIAVFAVCITAPVQFLNLYLSAFAQAHEDFLSYKVNTLIAAVLNFLITLVAVITDEYALISSIFFVVPLARATHYGLSLDVNDFFRTLNQRARGSFADAIALIRLCRNLIIQRLTGFLFNQIDKIIIGIFFGSEQLGFFDFAKKLVSPLGAISSLLLSAVYPRIVNTPERDRMILCRQYLSVYTLLITGVFLLFLACGGIMLTLFPQSRDSDMVVIASILCLTSAVSMYSSFYSTVGLALRITGFVASSAVFQIMINLLISAAGIVVDSIFVVIYGTIFSYLLITIRYMFHKALSFSIGDIIPVAFAIVSHVFFIGLSLERFGLLILVCILLYAVLALPRLIREIRAL